MGSILCEHKSESSGGCKMRPLSSRLMQIKTSLDSDAGRSIQKLKAAWIRAISAYMAAQVSIDSATHICEQQWHPQVVWSF